MTTRIPPEWMPDAPVKRLILHWTAGGYSATALDRRHYHVLIEASGRHVRGIHSIADNCPLNRERYAAHTLDANGGSVGLAVCCMLDAVESPFRPGPRPLTKKQWNALILACADLCRRYSLPVTPRTVLGHGEVERVLGIKQNGKWEFKLPWQPTWSVRKCGDELRRRVALAIREKA